MRELPPVLLSQLRACAAALVADNEDIVIACGSRVEGFGNAQSDIDLLVIAPDGEGAPQQTPDGRAPAPAGAPVPLEHLIRMLGLGEFGLVDAERIARGSVDDLISRVNAGQPGKKNVAEIIDLEQYYRFAVGVAVVNEERYEAIRSRMSLDHLGRLLLGDADTRTAEFVAQITRHLHAGLPEIAADLAQVAVSWALHGYLIAQGDRFPPRKWRFEKLARLHGEEHPLYWRAWQLKAPGNRPPSSYAADCLDFIAQLRPAISSSDGAGSAPWPGARASSEERRHLLMAELRYCKDLADVAGAIDAGQRGMAFHALGRVCERLQDAWLIRSGVYHLDAATRRGLVRAAANRGEPVARRIVRVQDANQDGLGALAGDLEECVRLARVVGFRLGLPTDLDAVAAFHRDVSEAFSDLAQFKMINYLASAGVAAEPAQQRTIVRRQE